MKHFLKFAIHIMQKECLRMRESVAYTYNAIFKMCCVYLKLFTYNAKEMFKNESVVYTCVTM